MTVKLATAVSALALFFAASPAVSADLPKGETTPDVFAAPSNSRDFQGFYAALFAGYSIGDLHSDTPDEGIASHTPFIGGRVGYDAEIANRIVVGVFADAAYLSPSILGENLSDHNIDANYELAGGLRVGLVLNHSLLYVNGGYAWVPVDFGSDKIDLTGPFVGGGIEVPLGGGFSVGAEGRYQWLSDTPTGCSCTIDHDDLSARVIIAKRF